MITLTDTFTPKWQNRNQRFLIRKKTNVLRKLKKAREERKVKKKIKTKRKQYSGDMLDKALEFVKKGNTFMKASEKFGVPVTTLYRKLKNPKTKNVRSGPPTILSSQDEQQIANWIKYRAERGWPVTKPVVASNEAVVSEEPVAKFSNLNKDHENSDTINTCGEISECIESHVEKSFANAFVLPEKYLPKKKRQKLSGKGKPKLLSAGTSDGLNQT